MSDVQINIAIAEACGWEVKVKKYLAKPPNGEWQYRDKIPNYCNDLNAMHEAEATLDFEQAELFEDELCDVAFKNNKRLENPPPWRFSVCHATARQRAEAFLRTINKWEGGSDE